MNANLLKFIAGLIGLAVWAWLAFLKMTPIEPLIDLLKMALGGLVVHMLQDGGAPAQLVQMPAIPPGKSTEGGFALPRLLAAIAAIAFGLAMLGGCTTTTASMYRGYASEAVAGVKMWDDNTLATVQTILCGQPYSAIQRHPELQPGVQALCGPLANTASLDANQLALLMGILQSSGVKLQAAPAK